MELSVKDRLYLPTFLPARGNFKEFNLKKEILRKIAIGDEERKAINLRENAEASVSSGTWRKSIPWR